MSTPAEALHLALGHQRAGQLPLAEAIYHQILQDRPGQPDALHLLGLCAQQRGQYEQAVALIRRAIESDPEMPVFHNNLGTAYKALGKLDEAVAAYRRALSLHPDFAEAHNNLGNALRELGRPIEAQAACQQALALRPGYAEAHNNLGTALQAQGRLTEAAACYERAVALNPSLAQACNNLGGTLRELGRLEDAAAAYRRVVALLPGQAPAHNNLGTVLQELGQLKEAMACYRQALTLQPDHVSAQTNLGVAFQELGLTDEAVACHRRALLLQPGDAEAHNNLGTALKEQGLFDEAQLCYEEALRSRPDYAAAHLNQALLLLLRGELERGFAEFEWRWGKDRAPPRRLSAPLWDGSPLLGKVILLYPEQGLGDTLHFVRYAPLLTAQGATVLLESPPALLPLLKSMRGVARHLAPGEAVGALDAHAPLLSLPRLCGTTLSNIPAEVPYLHAPERRPLPLLREGGAGLRAGLVWAGNPRFKNDRNRSCPLEAFVPLLAEQGVARFVSLQKGPRAGDIERLHLGDRLADLSAGLGDFADTAAVVAQLDLVITIDTSVAHLAGALGRQAWLLLSFVADWRWLVGRTDSPWYPSLRLFRQARPGDWAGVIEAVRRELRALTPPARS